MRAIRVIMAFYFGWHALITVGVMVRPMSMDRLVFKAAGLLWIFWPLAVLSVFLSIAACRFVVRPFPGGFRLVVAALAVGFAESAIAGMIGVLHPQIARGAFVQSRVSRDLIVHDEILWFMEHPSAHFLMILLTVAWGFLIAFLVYRSVELPRRELISPPG